MLQRLAVISTQPTLSGKGCVQMKRKETGKEPNAELKGCCVFVRAGSCTGEIHDFCFILNTCSNSPISKCLIEHIQYKDFFLCPIPIQR